MKTLTRITVLSSIAVLLSLQLYSQNEPTVLVSADNMNILYLGLDNPISIAACGITNDKLNVSITNGTITGSNGRYIAKPGSGRISIIVVSAENESGEIKQISSILSG